MPWDTARTRRLLFEAAIQEFSDHGRAGARVDRIAAAAGVNKERIYQYFGNKQQLFEAVLEQEMAKFAAAIPMDDELAADLGQFAAKVYDYHRTYPHYLRLLLWEGLDLSTSPPTEPAAAEERSHRYAAHIRAVARAQAAGALRADVAPAYLLYTARSMAAWWLATPSLADLMLGDNAADTTAARRAVLVSLVNSATRPAP
ncbi:TetR/AcrR family transcriptional regulator [Streptomyces werraensis]|uniref:TetR/AcrR family transcriptional regulator n=1 Tax=Streptomyces werraensis TaxID=68284 RepID=UPI001CE2EA41